MSQIKEQGIWNTLLSYFGVGIGVLNLIFLYPFFFETDEIGLIRILTSISILYAQVASVGFNSVIIRFFPHFRNRNNGFPFAVLLFSTIGFLLTTVLLLLLRPVIEPIYIENSQLFVEYYTWLIPLSLFVLFCNIGESFLLMQYRTVFTLFIKEVLLRLLTLAGILTVAFDYINFEQFLVWFLVIHALTLLIISVPLYRSAAISFVPDFTFFKPRRLKLILRYGFVSLLTGATAYFIQLIDSLMIGAYLDLDQVGVYTIAFFMGSVIAMPARGISRIAVPMVANAWKRKRPDRIQSLYKNTSFLQYTFGLLFLAGILANIEDVFDFLPEAFAAGSVVVLWIGIGNLIDMTGGLNSFILNTSPKYDRDLYFNLFFVVLCIITNILLIPVYGLMGAAIASASSYLGVNLVRGSYLWYVYRMQPFSLSYIRTTLVILASVVPATYLTIETGNPILNIIIRSIIILVLLTIIVMVTRTHIVVKHTLDELRNSEDT
ncbi:MAG: polysaccharide biosynthesis C-terminal domain-containing protein [Balneolales bacterium]|nr:polysaccharide biosynthesis C-terminal domain-containing protein [Balneolales bacterium]